MTQMQHALVFELSEKFKAPPISRRLRHYCGNARSAAASVMLIRSSKEGSSVRIFP